MLRAFKHMGALALAGGLAVGGCVGSIGDGDPDASKPPLPPGAEPDVAPLMKLSTLQYRNTVVDLLTTSGLASVLPGVEPFMASVPADGTDTFSALDNRVASEHLNGYFNVATGVGDAVEADAGLRGALAGECATESTLSAGCVDGFLGQFGRRVFRRPLTDEERGRYAELNDGERSPAEAIRAMVVTLMLAPQFLNHLEVSGVEFKGRDDVLQLSGYELASKLSYTFWQSMPDDALLDAAESGALGTEEGYASAVARVFDDPRTRETIWQFYAEWFRLERFAGFQANRPAFQTLAEGENIGEPGHDHYGDMVQEIDDLTALIIWDEGGTLNDLLTTNVSVTPSDDLARLYGVEPYSGGSYPTFSDGERAGVLQRAALLANPLEQTNPFHRGAFIRNYILCDTLPAPDPNELPPGSLDPPPLDPEATTRERFQAKVQDNPLCEGCHGIFSDIGYVMEAYDALGRFRTIEKVLDEQNGDLIAELPIDTSAPARIDLSDTSTVEGPVDLNQRIVESGKMAACMSRQYFAYALRRQPGSAPGDQDLREQMASPEVPLAEVFKRVALHPSFKIRKVGAQ